MAHLKQMHLLVNLARIDGAIGEKEKQFIINIGQANHMMVAEILPLLSQEEPAEVPTGLTEDEKFELLVELVRLMKIDDRLYRAELRFVADVAARLGYDKEVLFELMLHVSQSGPPAGEADALRAYLHQHLHKE